MRPVLLCLALLCASFELAATARAAVGPRSWMTTPTPRPGAWMQRHAEFVALAQQGGIDVLFVGDSITDGWRNVGKAIWKRHFEPLKAANFGISGDGTHNVLWRLQNGELQGISPKVVVLLIGTNNIPWAYGTVTPDATVAQVTEAVTLLVRTIQQALPQSRILLLGILPRGQHPNPSRTVIGLVNTQLSALESDRVSFAEFGHVFLEGDEIPSSLMSDFLHPNARGYSLWGTALSPAVKALLRED